MREITPQLNTERYLDHLYLTMTIDYITFNCACSTLIIVNNSKNSKTHKDIMQ